MLSHNLIIYWRLKEITMNNKDYAMEYVVSRGLKETTLPKVEYVLDHYSQFQDLTIEELLHEADMEEDQGIRWKRRKLKTRLISYMNYCKSQMLLSSAKTYFNQICALYRHHEIEIGTLPRWNTKNANMPEPITSSDMLTKPLIREALKVANPLMSAIILTEASSGMTRSDVLGLTIGQFIDSTYMYHHENDIEIALTKMLEETNDIIGTWRMRRLKTNKYFITFTSPEAVLETCKYLQIRNQRNRKYHRPLLTKNDKLFKIHQAVYIDKFGEINKALNRDKAGTYNQIRGHMLRKFHATQLEKHGMSRAMVNVLQGKSNNAVDDVYFIEDENTLRNEYLRAMDGVLIFTDVKEITMYSPEYQKMETEIKQLKSRDDQLNELVRRIEMLEQGD